MTVVLVPLRSDDFILGASAAFELPTDARPRLLTSPGSPSFLLFGGVGHSVTSIEGPHGFH
jgi:hypothetical protein